MSKHAFEDIEPKIRSFLVSNLLFSTGEFPYGNSESLLRLGVVDSLGVLELVTFVGEEFAIAVEPREITPENFDSVDNLAAYIRRKMEAMDRDCSSAAAEKN